MTLTLDQTGLDKRECRRIPILGPWREMETGHKSEERREQVKKKKKTNKLIKPSFVGGH